MGDNWEDLADWWTEEVAGDPAYRRRRSLPLVLDLLEPRVRGAPTWMPDVAMAASCGGWSRRGQLSSDAT